MIDFFPQVTKVNVLNYHDADILQSVMSAKELLKHIYTERWSCYT